MARRRFARAAITGAWSCKKKPQGSEDSALRYTLSLQVELEAAA
jgi:hypothetical protein